MTDSTPSHAEEETSTPAGGDASEPSVAHLLQRCATSLTDPARAARRAYGVEAQIEAIWQLLRADSSKCPLIIGKARSGKTALAHELAWRIASGQCPEDLASATVYEISPSSLISALSFGEGWRENLNKLLQGLEEQGNAILFLRDAHHAVGAGKQGDDDSDLADALVTSLRNGKQRWLAEARADVWRVTASEDTTFTECFGQVAMPDLGLDAARPILEAAALDLAGGSAIVPQPEALEAALDVAARFLLNQALPGKAIDMLEDAIRYARRSGAQQLDAQHVFASFAERTGLAGLLLDDSQPFAEDEVQRYFSERVLGQEPAIAAVVQAIALIKARLNDPARPLGVFLFLGPTGVGKTELAKTLCAFLFGTEEKLLRFNMADYAFYWQYEELFGDPDADELALKRGSLSRRLAGESFGVVLLDEFEKAHEMIFQRFLQVFDEGILINPAGEEVNLRNMVIIMTSNFGAQLLQGEGWGFGGREDVESTERRIMRETESFFTPEFINRLDSVLFFKPLSLADMRHIAYRELRKLFQREGLTRRALTVELDDAVIDLLLKHGYSARYGARYLKRQIEKRISYPLARAILARPGEASGRTVRLYTRGEMIEAGWVREDSPEQEETSVVVDGQRRSLAPADLVASARQLRERLDRYRERIGVQAARERMDELLAEMSGPAFWDDSRAAETRLAELGEMSRQVDRSDELRRAIEDFEALVERVVARHQRRLIPDAARQLAQIEREIGFAELEEHFSAAEEWGDAYLVLSGAPGEAEAPRWGGHLAEMYTSWASGHDLTCTTVDEAPPEASAWRVTLLVEGRGAYGLLQAERGTHRFAEVVASGEARRKQVSQVRVEVIPAVEEGALRIPAADLLVEPRMLHSRGRRLRRLRGEARAVHLPSGTSATAATEGDASSAEALALALLRGRLSLGRAASAELEAEPPWGSVARAYQLSRRSQVKDPRTGVVSTNPRAVFEGALDAFIAAYLQRRSAQSAA
ncbi:AAA domain-containing protein [Chloroflexia bacterium SDU3-3]|nr:AAA domain-containing protein [Chloroflexia bacterium SDU3-3]